MQLAPGTVNATVLGANSVAEANSVNATVVGQFSAAGKDSVNATVVGSRVMFVQIQMMVQH